MTASTCNHTGEEDPVLLVIDTSGDWTNVALGKGDRLLGATSVFALHAHARLLAREIDLLLDSQRMVPADVGVVGVCVGPGSFTGLRVGITTAKGLCFSLSKPAVTVRATEALAASLPDVPLLGTAIDARKGEVYFALRIRKRQPRLPIPPIVADGGSCLAAGRSGTAFGGGLPEGMEHLCAPPEEGLKRLLSGKRGRVVLVGSACLAYRERLAEAGGSRVVFAPDRLANPAPELLYDLCLARFREGRTTDAAGLEPLYVRAPSVTLKRA